MVYLSQWLSGAEGYVLRSFRCETSNNRVEGAIESQKDNACRQTEKYCLDVNQLDNFKNLKASLRLNRANKASFAQIALLQFR
jgi:hypothetical protein